MTGRLVSFLIKIFNNSFVLTGAVRIRFPSTKDTQFVHCRVDSINSFSSVSRGLIKLNPQCALCFLLLVLYIFFWRGSDFMLPIEDLKGDMTRYNDVDAKENVGAKLFV